MFRERIVQKRISRISESSSASERRRGARVLICVRRGELYGYAFAISFANLSFASLPRPDGSGVGEARAMCASTVLALGVSRDVLYAGVYHGVAGRYGLTSIHHPRRFPALFPGAQRQRRVRPIFEKNVSIDSTPVIPGTSPIANFQYFRAIRR